MKKTTLFILSIVFFLISSCIPSLHSIVNEENRMVDDRIVGEWLMDENPFDSETIPFPVKTDDKEEEAEAIRLIAELMKEQQSKNKKFSSWKFERAARIVAKDEKAMTDPKGHGLTITLNVGAPSMLSEKLTKMNMTIVEKEEFPFYILTYTDTENNTNRMRVELTKINGDLYADFFPFGTDEEGRFSLNFIHAHTFSKLAFAKGKLLMQSFDIDTIENLLKSKRVRLKHEVIKNTVQENSSFVEEETMVLTASTEELRAFISKYGKDDDLFDDAEELIAINE